ncbi:type II toxin-antitoxin system RelE/ParE family toxin [Aurantimonas sp. C2-3-R2]|uniref:type II toxin-antitoxin system RelE/ParE family toxin n=1 Tax=unclassified Aurantimonas TaxID=2638230 RepID=UPI003FA49E7D
MREVRFSPAGYRDLAAVYLYTLKRYGADQADRYVSEIARSCERVFDRPGSSRDASRYRKGLRFHQSGRHQIFYVRSSSGALDVVRILHGRMNIEDHL